MNFAFKVERRGLLVLPPRRTRKLSVCFVIVLAPTPYRVSKNGKKYYRQESFLLTDDLTSRLDVLVQAYLDRYQIEFNHRDVKAVLGVGQAQVWSEKSTPRVPAFVVAAYSSLLLAGLADYGPKRGEEYRVLPKWRRNAKRPSCQDLVTLPDPRIRQF